MYPVSFAFMKLTKTFCYKDHKVSWRYSGLYEKYQPANI